MRTEFLRAAISEPPGPRAGTRARQLLRAYFDLTSEGGPLHAQGVADAGRHLADGDPIPAYQINTASLLRAALREEAAAATDPEDPRQVATADRSHRWNVLCALIDEWRGLQDGERVRAAAALNKLGFWASMVRLIPPGLPTDSSPELARLALLRCNAVIKSGDRSPAAFREAQRVLQTTAMHAAHPAETRLAAAIGLIVHHAKGDKAQSVVEQWAHVAGDTLAAAGHDRVGPVVVSAYWRAVSFAPFLHSDHTGVQEMMAEAEAAARAAMTGGVNAPLLARENLHPLLETRGRAWAWAGAIDRAEACYREMTLLDPEDPKVHVRLADFLLTQARPEEARTAYEQAALLGVPYTAYALTQAARCSHRLGEPERAVAALMQAVKADPRAVTPLRALGNLAGKAGLPAVAEWAHQQFSTLTAPQAPFVSPISGALDGSC